MSTNEVPTETPQAKAPPTDFEQLLQGLSQENSPPDSALPELLAAVASLVESSSLLKGIDLPAPGPSAKDRKPSAAEAPHTKDSLNDPLAMMEALRCVPPICFRPTGDTLTPSDVQPEATPQAALPEAISSAIEDVEILKQEAPSKPVLNLKDFDVRSFEFKTELEIATVPPKLIRIVPVLGVLPPQPRLPKDSADAALTTSATPSVLDRPPDAPLIAAPEAVERVRVVVEPPPPPPVARQVSMDIGDAESEVRVVIRERNGELSVQFGAATERLRENLENAAPLLMQELRRDNPQTVNLDFTSFGSATDSGRDAQQDSPRKKPLKPEAVFADRDETAYPEQDTPSDNSF